MTKQSEDKPSAVPKVDLLNPAVEPTDAELEALMRDMMRAVREKHDKTVQAGRAALIRAIRDGHKAT